MDMDCLPRIMNHMPEGEEYAALVAMVRKHNHPHIQLDMGLLNEVIEHLVQRTRLSEAQNHRCAYCGVKTDFAHRLLYPTVEHIVPRIRLGSRTSDLNCVMACHRCNQKRNDRYIEEEELVGPEARVSTFEPNRKKPPSQFAWNNQRFLYVPHMFEIGSYRYERHGRYYVSVNPVLIKLQSAKKVREELAPGFVKRKAAVNYITRYQYRFLKLIYTGGLVLPSPKDEGDSNTNQMEQSALAA